MLARMSEKKSPVDGRIPPMNSLRVFEAAARHESFGRAADELHVTHGAVSRQIKQLEESLGVDLFDRRNRAVFLTPRGKILLEACTEAMERLAEALRQVRAPAVELPLVLSCEPTIAMRWLIPRLPAFRERFPQHQIHLLTAGGPVDFARDRVDLALRRNDFNWGTTCHAEPVAPELTGPVCSPAVAQAVATGLLPARKPKLLHARTRPTAWQRWVELGGCSPDAGASEHFEHFYLSLQAAGAGLGWAIGSAYMVADDLQDARLVAPFGFQPDGSEYVLLSPTPFQDDPRRMLFLDWLRHEMGCSRQRVESWVRVTA
ncbi:LysR family transcriptional regulator [Sphaerotilus sp. FB-3]|jgi:DNA-binding transcriptional LysR family regulator|nr:LysR family transcriptional regulator [Sphaerotilus sp. FB-3]